MTHGDLMRRLSVAEYMHWRALYQAESDERKAEAEKSKSKKR